MAVPSWEDEDLTTQCELHSEPGASVRDWPSALTVVVTITWQ